MRRGYEVPDPQRYEWLTVTDPHAVPSQWIPSARFNNFITDYRGNPVNEGNSRTVAVAAWKRMKSVPGPKTFEAYAALKPSRRRQA